LLRNAEKADIDSASRRAGDGAPRDVRLTRLTVASQVPQQALAGKRASEAGGSPQDSKSGGGEGDTSGAKTPPTPATASPPPT